MEPSAKLVPELLVSDFTASYRFYTEVLGFVELYAREEDRFCYLGRNGAELMLEQFEAGDMGCWVAGDLQQPFGRGANFEIAVDDVDAMLATCVKAGARIFLPMEEKWYRRNEVLLGVRQFIVQDPDGYLLRLQQNIGTRSREG